MTSSKLKLPNVTLVALTDKKINQHIHALRKSMEGIEFGRVLLLSTDEDSVIGNGNEQPIENKRIAPLKSIDAWNRSVIYEMPKFIETSYMILIHEDGYIINPSLWDSEWLRYDYIGAPWPLPNDTVSYRDEVGNVMRVGNSVSLRSKRLVDLAATRKMVYHYLPDGSSNNNEDGHICCHNRRWLESQGCNFAPLEVAVHFSKEHNIPENVGLETFAFHSL